MTTSKTLPARPSLESLLKQAKKLAHNLTAGDAAAIARARLQLQRVIRDNDVERPRRGAAAGWGISASPARGGFA
jgi:hypothetical protein